VARKETTALLAALQSLEPRKETTALLAALQSLEPQHILRWEPTIRKMIDFNFFFYILSERTIFWGSRRMEQRNHTSSNLRIFHTQLSQFNSAHTLLTC
jgi:hypothetical protein